MSGQLSIREDSNSCIDVDDMYQPNVTRNQQLAMNISNDHTNMILIYNEIETMRWINDDTCLIEYMRGWISS